MSDHPCITLDLERVNRADRPRQCMIRGEHYAACPDPDTCRGCVPREAEHGMLCAACWLRLQDALSRVESLVTHLRSIDSNGQAIGERVATSMQIRLVIPDSWLAADGLMGALGAPKIPSTASIDETFRLAKDAVNLWTDPEGMVTGREGAKRAVVLVRRMQTALNRWPDAEAQHRHIPYVLCPNCRYQHLWRRAPLEYLDEIRVECSTNDLGYERGLGYDTCSYRMDWFRWLELYSPIIAGIFKEQDRAKHAARRKEQG